jgi:predicted DNA-binding transcriptional regulator AlpA
MYKSLDSPRDVEHDVLLSTSEFERITGVKRSMRYIKWDARDPSGHDPSCPRPIKISPRSNRFSLNATNLWVRQQVDRQRPLHHDESPH